MVSDLMRLEPLIDKVMRRMEPIPESGCWVFTGTTSKDGYGQVGGGKSRPKRYAHRVSYEHFVGEIPAGLCLDHLCRVRCCVNPAHLEAVTMSVNLQRGVDARPKKSHCKNGHPFAESTYKTPRQQVCGICMLAAKHRQLQKKRAT